MKSSEKKLANFIKITWVFRLFKFKDIGRESPLRQRGSQTKRSHYSSTDSSSTKDTEAARPGLTKQVLKIKPQDRKFYYHIKRKN